MPILAAGSFLVVFEGSMPTVSTKLKTMAVLAAFLLAMRQVAVPSGVFSLPPTGVTAGTYGDSTHVGQFTVDAYGRLTSASSVAISGSGGNGSGPLFTSTASATVANTAVETSLIGSGVGSLTLPANFFSAGTSLRVSVAGVFGTKATPGTIRIRLKLGSTVILDTGAVTPADSITNEEWQLQTLITCRTAGATGTVIANATVPHGDGSTAALFGWRMVNTSTITVDTTATQTVAMTALWSTADTANTISTTNFEMYSAGSGLPSYSGNSGLFLGLNGTPALEWAAPVSVGAYASIPAAAAANTGRVYISNDAPWMVRSTGSVNQFWFLRLYSPLDQSGWSWVNQDSATVTQSNGVVFLDNGTSTGGLKQRVTSVPGASFTIIAVLQPYFPMTNFVSAGLEVRDSGTSKIISFGMLGVGANSTSGGGAIARIATGADKWTNSTTFSASITSVPFEVRDSPRLKVQYVSGTTTFTYSISLDGGVNYATVGTDNSGFLANPDQYGIYVHQNQCACIPKLAVLSLTATTP